MRPIFFASVLLALFTSCNTSKKDNVKFSITDQGALLNTHTGEYYYEQDSFVFKVDLVNHLRTIYDMQTLDHTMKRLFRKWDSEKPDTNEDPIRE